MFLPYFVLLVRVLVVQRWFSWLWLGPSPRILEIQSCSLHANFRDMN
jgi:hypothetical protein